MTQEEKELLLKDLNARLPYGVKFKADDEEYIREIHYIKDENIYIREYRNLPYWIDSIKPYLRPMSSITEEEKEELYHYYCNEIADNLNTPNLTWKIRCCISNSFGTDWLNAHHFDYRGLIPMGLALEAPEGMYNLNE